MAISLTSSDLRSWGQYYMIVNGRVDVCHVSPQVFSLSDMFCLHHIRRHHGFVGLSWVLEWINFLPIGGIDVARCRLILVHVWYVRKLVDDIRADHGPFRPLSEGLRPDLLNQVLTNYPISPLIFINNNYIYRFITCLRLVPVKCHQVSTKWQ